MKNLFLILFCIFCIPYVSAQVGPIDINKIISAKQLEKLIPAVLKGNVENLKKGKYKTNTIAIIGRIAKSHPKLFSTDILNDLFVTLENNSDDSIKEAIGRALLTVGTEPALAKLRDTLKNANSATRLAVLRVFLYEKKLDNSLIQTAMKDPDPKIRMTIVSAGAVFAEDVELRKVLEDLADNDLDLGVKLMAVRTLIALEVAQEDDSLPTPTVIPKEIKECLEAIASSKDKKIKQAAVDKLIAMGKAAVQPAIWELLEITANEDPEARYYTAMALKGIGDKTAICGLKSGIYYEEVPCVRSMMEDALKHLQSLPD